MLDLIFDHEHERSIFLRNVDKFLPIVLCNIREDIIAILSF
jgi:hypothetical protein